MRGGRKEGRSLVEPGPPPRVRLSETGMREAGTEPRPFHSTRCLNRGDKRAGRTAAASPLGRSSGSGTETLRRRWGGGGGKWRRPRGRGRFRHTAAAARCRLRLLRGGRGLPGRGVEPRRGRRCAASLRRRFLPAAAAAPLGRFPAHRGQVRLEAG